MWHRCPPAPVSLRVAIDIKSTHKIAKGSSDGVGQALVRAEADKHFVAIAIIGWLKSSIVAIAILSQVQDGRIISMADKSREQCDLLGKVSSQGYSFFKKFANSIDSPIPHFLLLDKRAPPQCGGPDVA